MLKEQERIRISRETLRKWLRPEGFGGKAGTTQEEKEGRMLFLDGSPHVW